MRYLFSALIIAAALGGCSTHPVSGQAGATLAVG